MNRGQMQYKMRGQMMRNARRSAMRNHGSSRSIKTSDDGVLGAVVILVLAAVMFFIILSLLGVWVWGILFFVGVPLMAGWLVHLVQKSGNQTYPHSAQKAADPEAEPVWIAEAIAQRGELPSAPVSRLQAKTAPPKIKAAPVAASVLTPRQKQDRDDLRMREESRWRKEARDRRVAVPALKTLPSVEADLERKLQGLERQVREGSSQQAS